MFRSAAGLADPATPRTPSESQKRHRLGLLCALVFLTALALRLSFSLAVHQAWVDLPQPPEQKQDLGFLNRDSASYLRPAKNLLAGNVVNAGSVRRPPGYPFLLALCGARYLPILIAQSFLTSLMPVAVLLLVHRLTAHFALAVIGAVPLVVSPTGIGVTAQVMADGLLGVLVAAGVLLLAVAAREQSRTHLLWAGAVFGFGVLVKPLLVFWWPLSLVLLFLFSRSSARQFRLGTVILFLALQLIGAFGWSLRNRIADGTFTLSGIGPLTTRIYLMARVEALVEAGREPTNEEIGRKQVTARRRDRELGGDWGARILQFRQENRDIFLAHPAATAHTYRQNVRENLVQRWRDLSKQLPGLDEESLPERAVRLEQRARRGVPFTLLASLLAAGLAWAVTRSRTSFQRAMDALALCLVWMFFVLASGVTFWTGPRILYPTQIAVVPVLLLGGLALAELARRARSRLRTRPA